MAIRATVKYTGNVQGVGFRATCHNIAGRYQITGYVRNDEDGTVTLVAEGNETEVDTFLDAVDKAMSGYIQKTHVTKDPSERAFDAFDIRFA